MSADDVWVSAMRLATGEGMVTTMDTGVSLQVAADLLGVNPRTLKRQARAGRLPTYWVGKTEMVSMDTVAAVKAGTLDLRTSRARQRDARGRFVGQDGQDERSRESGAGTDSVERTVGWGSRGAGG